MISTIFITAVIVVVSPKLSEHEFVFTSYNNDTGLTGNWSTTTYVCMVGVLMSLYGLSGYESGATMAEETNSGASNAPKGIIEAVIASVITGFVFIVGLLYEC